MLSLVKLMPRQANLICKCASGVLTRSIYTPASFGIDAFLNYKAKLEREEPGKSVSIKTTVNEALSKPNSPLFTEDLKVLVYSAQTESDVDLLINALKKYHNQDSVAIFNYNFDASLMRLLYTLNQVDKALALYLNEEITFFGKSAKVPQMLMNKLLEEKRYDDVVKVFDKLMKKNLEKEGSDKNMFGLIIPLNIVTEALLFKNNSEALAKAKSILSAINNAKFEISDNGLIRVFLLALQQKDPQFAYELTALIKGKNQSIIKNLQTLSFLDLNRKDEALQLAIQLNTESNLIANRKSFYKITLDRLLESFKNEADAEKKKKVDDLIDNVSKNSQVREKDLKEEATQLNTIKKKTNELNNRSFGNFRDREAGKGTAGGDFERRNFNPNNSFSNRNRDSSLSGFSNKTRNSDNFQNRRPQQQQQGQNKRRTNEDDDN